MTMSEVIRTVYLLALLFCLAPLSSNALAAKKPTKKRSTGGGFGAGKVAWQHTADESAETQRLMEFLRSNKAEFPNIEVGFSETGMRGLYSTKSFGNKGGQLLCKIPSDVALALNDPEQEGDDTCTVAEQGLNFLNMYLNDPEKRKLWAPYLDTLPPKESVASDVTPDGFTDEEIGLLEFPRIVNAARARKEEIKKLAEANSTPLEDMRYATWIGSSRSFNIAVSKADEDEQKNEGENEDDGDVMYDDRGQIIVKSGERKGISVLVPLLDMANHNSKPNAKLIIIDPEKDEAWFALESLRPIPAGKEITIAYGRGSDSSADLLLNYGFVSPEENRLDAFMLKRGGEDIIKSQDGWTTTLDEDQAMLGMTSEEDVNLKKILAFRIKMKKAYTKD